ncbi:MAG: carboxypeptidase-like regulatory domain-containing protein [Crocinitomicaceae bacterium]|nr:carboxypeptidase-like regulatory domain-containing protein [Crocinitomicaceae bacterium]
MKKIFLICVCVFLAINSFSQSIQGFVYDESNNPIPYAKVYVKNFTNLGAITDEEGKYFFGCEMGTYDVIYKCIGFEEQVVKVTVSDLKPVVQNIYLKQAQNELNVVEVETKRRNIGWEIIQNVIAHKKDMIRQFDEYSCDVYIKGTETYDVKKKEKKEDEEEEPSDMFQKQKDEIQDKLNGENRLNMVEINLEKHFQYPNKMKEIRTGYDKIGKPDQIYFQTTTSGDFNFYESLIKKYDLHRTPIVSPLHPAGILSYKYKLKEVIHQDNDTIYKIEVSARSVGTSTMEGFLWVLKNEWVLTKVDVSMHKGNLKKYDNFHLIQEYEKIDSFWVVNKQIFEYDTKYMKEKVKGITTVTYSNWNFNPDFPPKHFSNEIGITTEEAY